MSVRLLFLDSSNPKPYDAVTLETEPQGGTESTVTRVAEGLASRGYDVIVAQKGRTEAGQGKAKYIGLDHLDQIQHRPYAVISLRSPELAKWAGQKFTDTKRFLWLHDFNQQKLVQAYPLGPKTEVICVSRHHQQTVADALLSQLPPPIRDLKVSFIYNPVANLEPDHTPVDNKKLIYTASPHKGLEHAVYLFRRLRDIDSSFSLYVANPGYLPSATLLDDGVVSLGALPHGDLITHVRTALAVFHPNAVFPETFGIAAAEANQVGTPVLTAGIGAMREVLSDPRQILPVRDEKTVIDTILRWSAERPVVRGNPDFKLSNVLSQWEVTLGAK